MNIMVLSSVSVALYLLGTGYQILAYLRKVELKPFTTFLIGVTASICQLLITSEQIYTDNTINFNAPNSASLVTAIIVFSLALLSVRRPLHIIKMIMYPIALACLVGMLTIQVQGNYFTPSDSGIIIHIMLSVIAYCVLSIAAIQAALVHLQNSNLKKRHNTVLIRNLPPLLTMEKLMFEMLWSGTILLALAITAGFIFIDNLFAQQLAHKTFFSILALVIFTTLLIGRHKYGWRGAKASSLTLWGAVFLMLGFLGSKLVLEWFIH